MGESFHDKFLFCLGRVTGQTPHHSVGQGSATPGTRATSGARKDFSWHAKRFDAHAKSKLTSSNCLHCTKSTVSKLVKHAFHLTISVSAMSVNSHTHNWLAVRAKELAQDNLVHASSH